MPRFRKILPLFLILLILAGSSHFTLSLHYCMGHLRNVALFGSAGVCEMPAMDFCTHKKDSGYFKVKGCCEDLSLSATTVDDFTPVAGFLLSCSLFVPELFSIRPVYELPLALYRRFPVYYSPPPPARDIPVLIQSFLI